MKSKAKKYPVLTTMLSTVLILLGGTNVVIASNAVDKETTFDITSKIFIDGSLVSSPRIITPSHQEALITLSNKNETQGLRIKVIADNESKNKISIKYDIDYKDNHMNMHTNPYVIVGNTQEARIRSSYSNHIFEMIVLAKKTH